MVEAATLTTAVTLVGLAVAAFFLTAQLRISGLGRYGLTEIYQARNLTPLFGTGSVCVAASLVAIALCEVNATGAGIAAAVSAGSLLWALLQFIIVTLTAVLYLDNVTAARRFSRQIQADDTATWGLVELDLEQGIEHVGVSIISNRMNFGMRDPLMPIHELILASAPKQFGALIGVMLERVVADYGLKWKDQAPDPDQWAKDPAGTRRPTRAVRKAPLVDELTDDVVTSKSQGRRRLELLLLILHYVRRVPEQKLIADVPYQARRDETLFQLALLASILATEKPRGLRKHSVAPEIERRVAAQMSLFAAFEVVRENARRQGTTAGRPQALIALAACARDLRIRGWHEEAGYAADVLSWAVSNSNQLDPRWLDTVRNNLGTASPELAARLPRRWSFEAEPAVVIQNPWIEWRTQWDRKDSSATHSAPRTILGRLRDLLRPG